MDTVSQSLSGKSCTKGKKQKEDIESRCRQREAISRQHQVGTRETPGGQVALEVREDARLWLDNTVNIHMRGGIASGEESPLGPESRQL